MHFLVISSHLQHCMFITMIVNLQSFNLRIYIYMYVILLNYNFIVTHMVPREIPVMCLRGPHFLVAWDIHILCNLPCATCGIIRHGVGTHVTAMHGTCLGKYLTMPYRINAMKQFFS